MKIAKLKSGVLIHLLHESTVSKSTQIVQVRSGFGTKNVMAKRTIMEVWKVKKKGSNSGEGKHKSEGSPVVDTV